jgi:hypothetical protein
MDDATLMDYQQAQFTVAKYCCSRCFGHLVIHPCGGNLVHVLCGSCGENTKGYVSKHYAEQRRQESMGERVEAAYVLRNVIKSAHAGKTETQLLKEIGY